MPPPIHFKLRRNNDKGDKHFYHSTTAHYPDPNITTTKKPKPGLRLFESLCVRSDGHSAAYHTHYEMLEIRCRRDVGDLENISENQQRVVGVRRITGVDRGGIHKISMRMKTALHTGGITSLPHRQVKDGMIVSSQHSSFVRVRLE